MVKPDAARIVSLAREHRQAAVAQFNAFDTEQQRMLIMQAPVECKKELLFLTHDCTALFDEK